MPLLQKSNVPTVKKQNYFTRTFLVTRLSAMNLTKLFRLTAFFPMHVSVQFLMNLSL